MSVSDDENFLRMSSSIENFVGESSVDGRWGGLASDWQSAGSGVEGGGAGVSAGGVGLGSGSGSEVAAVGWVGATPTPRRQRAARPRSLSSSINSSSSQLPLLLGSEGLDGLGVIEHPSSAVNPRSRSRSQLLRPVSIENLQNEVGGAEGDADDPLYVERKLREARRETRDTGNSIPMLPPAVQSGVRSARDRASYPMRLWRKFQDYRGFKEGTRSAYPRIWLNNGRRNREERFPDNTYHTTKYSVLTFLPKVLLEQLRKATTFYFLLITIITLFPSITPISPYTSVMGLAFILLVAALRELYEDIKRLLADHKVNTRRYRTVAGVPKARANVSRGLRLVRRAMRLRRVRSEAGDLSELDQRLLGLADAGPGVRGGSPGGHRPPPRGQEKDVGVGVDDHVDDDSSWLGGSSAAPRSGAARPELFTLRSTASRNLRVGDLVYVRQDEALPADVMVIKTGLADGVCYIETASLDGETSLKLRRAPDCTNTLELDQVPLLEGTIDCECPHHDLYTFNGSMRLTGFGTPLDELEAVERSLASAYLKRSGAAEVRSEATGVMQHQPQLDQGDEELAEAGDDAAGPGGEAEVAFATVSLDQSHLLLGSSILRNTPYAIGVVVYAGPETKQSLNRKKPPSKFSTLDRKLDVYVIVIFAFTMFMSVLLAALGTAFNHEHEGNPFLRLDRESLAWAGVKLFFAYFVLMSFLIPLSLVVTLEVVKVVQGRFMEWDPAFFSSRNGRGMRVKTTNLNDELGLVQYIFSDKTGTLTENVMEFRKCFAGQRALDAAALRAWRGTALCAAVAAARDARDPALHVWLDRDPTARLLLVMALCHSIVTDRREDTGALVYKSSSPDEEALCEGAARFGFRLRARTSEGLALQLVSSGGDRGGSGDGDGDDGDGDEPPLIVRYQVLATMEFTSDRRRMSVLVRTPSGKIKLLSKGADSVMMERLRQADRRSEAAEVVYAQLEAFSVEGLRTLALAERELSEAEYRDWHARYVVAVNKIKGRDTALARVCEEIENDLELVGCTAIEDRLQEHVPETLRTLIAAGVRVWVITGDKQSTAINIGYSSQLLMPDTRVVKVNSKTSARCEALLQRFIEKYVDGTKDKKKKMMMMKSKKKNKIRRGKMKSRVVTFQQSEEGSGLLKEKERYDENETDDDDDDDDKDEGEDEEEEGEEEGGEEEDKDDDDGINFFNDFSAEKKGKEVKKKKKKNSKMKPKKNDDERELAAGKSVSVAMVIDGNTLRFALEHHPLLFLKASAACSALICNRVTPLQKAKIVQLVRNHTGACCLAIGDGANDVGMIQAANIGVGLFGREGSEAANSADFALRQFSHLQRLVMVSGRHSLIRNAFVIQYSFYKNATVFLSQIWFSFFCGYSGQTLYDSWQMMLFNLVFTSLPPTVVGVMEEDLHDSVLTRFPREFRRSQENHVFTIWGFVLWVASAFYHSLAIFFLAYAWWGDGAVNGKGRDLGFFVLGNGMLMVGMNVIYLKLALEINTWNVWTIISIVASLLSYYFFSLAEANVLRFFPEQYSAFMELSLAPSFWLYQVICVTIVLLPDFLFKYVRRTFFPESWMIRQEIGKVEREAALTTWPLWLKSFVFDVQPEIEDARIRGAPFGGLEDSGTDEDVGDSPFSTPSAGAEPPALSSSALPADSPIFLKRSKNKGGDVESTPLLLASHRQQRRKYLD